MLLSVLQSRFIMQKVKIKKGCRTPQPLQALLQDIIAWENCQGFIKLFERPGRQSWSRPEGRINVVSRASAGLLSLRHTSASGLRSINPMLLNSPSVVLGSSSQLKQYDLGFLKVTCFCHRRMRNLKSLTNK